MKTCKNLVKTTFNSIARLNKPLLISGLIVSSLALQSCGGGGGGGSGPSPQQKKAKFTIYNSTLLKNSSLYTSSEGMKLSITGTAGCSLSSTSVSSTAPVTATFNKASGSCTLTITPESGSANKCSSDTITHDGLLTPKILDNLNRCLHNYSIDDKSGSKKDVLNLKTMPGRVGYFTIYNQTKSLPFYVGGGLGADQCFSQTPKIIPLDITTELKFNTSTTSNTCNATFDFGNSSNDLCLIQIKNIKTANPMLDVKALQQCDAYKTWAKPASDIDSWTSVAKYNMGLPLRYRGVSLAGGAFDGANHAADSDDFGLLPIKEDANLFVAKGANTFRVPIAMEYATEKSEPKKGVAPEHTANYELNFNTEYWTKLKKAITALLNGGAYVIVDLHNYGHFNLSDPGLDPTDTHQNTAIGDTTRKNAPTAEQFGKFWGGVVQQLGQIDRDNHLMFELMNEPQNLPNKFIEHDYSEAIKNIRQNESQHHTIILDGNGWSGLHYWTAQNNISNSIGDKPKKGECNSRLSSICNQDWLKTLINSFSSASLQGNVNNPLMIDVHQYVDKDFSGTTKSCRIEDTQPIDDTNGYDLDRAMPIWFNELNDYLEHHKRKDGTVIPYILGEFGGYYDGEDKQCTKNLHDLLSAVKKSNAAGYLWWSAGHGFNSDYPLNIGPGACYGNQFMYSPIMSHKPFIVRANDSTWEDNFKPKTVKTRRGGGGVDFNQGLLPDETVGINTFTLRLENPDALTNKKYNVYDAVPAHGYSLGYPIDYSKPTCRTLNATNHWTQKLPVPTAEQKVKYGLFEAIDPSDGEDDKFMHQLYDIGFTSSYGYASKIKINDPKFTVFNSAEKSGVKSEDMVTIKIKP